MKSIRTVARFAGARFLAILLGATCLSASAQTVPQPTRADAEKDPVLKAMLTELDRSMSQLQLKDFQKPFFIQYRIEEIDSFETRAEFGATSGSRHNHGRVARVTVRVGDYKTDSSGGPGDGAVQIEALDNDPIALRSALWMATDQAYKSALAAYAQKQAALKQVETPPQADDFSKEAPVISLAEPLKLDVDEQAWEARVARVSGLYRTDASVKDSQRDVQNSTGNFSARVTTTWLVTSEGAIVRKSAASGEQSLSVGAQAADGMRLELTHSSIGVSLKDLDPPEVFEKHALKLITYLAELRLAPVVEEEYHGPVLLSSSSGTYAIYTLLAGGLTATRPRLGTEARTNGPFASSYHAHVLPESFNVVDDPGLKSYDGKGLVGAYDVDDEGVPALSVKLINDGRLENYLIGREPVRDFPQSNGHGRAGLATAPKPSIGVLQVTAKDGLTEEELNNKLLALAKDRGLKSVYYVASLGGKLTPHMLYRVSLDGKRELVRGAEISDLDLRALRSNVEAAGKDLRVANYLGEIPSTVLAPALLIDDVTIRRANKKNDKLPFYPPPE
ncbi:MAG TPA: metallopeptidase TldD-related protein [Terracidiphilus sp.]|jgi:predicted Zn-dependent protease